MLTIVLNVLDRSVPTNCIMTMAAIAIRAAIRPYSIAVTPFLFSNRRQTMPLLTPCSSTRPSRKDKRCIIFSS